MYLLTRAFRWIALLSLAASVDPWSPLNAEVDDGSTTVALPTVQSVGSLPGFSLAGRGSVAAEPPTVTSQTHKYFDVTEFGAIPDDGLSDREAVKLAIAAAEAYSGPSVVWIAAGRCMLRGPDDVGAESLRIRRSHVVLEGAGMYSGGTELFLASESMRDPAVVFKPELNPSIGERGNKLLSKLGVVPRRGQREVAVFDPRAVSVGDIVLLKAVLPHTFSEFRRFFEPLSDEKVLRQYFSASYGNLRYCDPTSLALSRSRPEKAMSSALRSHSRPTTSVSR